jgi:hypothetical protein
MKIRNMLLTAATALIASAVTGLYAEDTATTTTPPAKPHHKKYDKDGNGKLSDSEKAEKEKELIKRFDKDGDGKLSDSEKAEMEKAKEKHGKKRHQKDGDSSSTTTMPTQQ